MCVMRWLKLAERVNLGSAQKSTQNSKEIDILMRRDGGPSTKTRRGASDWLGDSPCCGGIVRCEMHAELCKIDQSVSAAFYLRRRLHGGVWGL